jgi:hypothetical protein
MNMTQISRLIFDRSYTGLNESAHKIYGAVAHTIAYEYAKIVK